jgi:hypothetical protein
MGGGLRTPGVGNANRLNGFAHLSYYVLSVLQICSKKRSRILCDKAPFQQCRSLDRINNSLYHIIYILPYSNFCCFNGEAATFTHKSHISSMIWQYSAELETPSHQDLQNSALYSPVKQQG